MSTETTAPADPMFEQAYMDVQKVLDEALGTEEEDGAGAGIAADVWLLAHQRDEARAELARLKAREAPVIEGPAAKALRDADQIEAAAAILERRYPSSRPERLDDTIGELHAIGRSWRRMADAHPDMPAGDFPCCTGCGPSCDCGGSPHPAAGTAKEAGR